jgi:arsenate reductase (glutaredoxin)
MTTAATVRVYHNSRCSKSRATLALLEQRGVAFEVVNYLDDPPSQSELSVLLQQLRMSPRELLRTGEAEYRTLGLNNPALDDAALIAAMVAHPILIERPIVVANGKAAIGRPPESVLAIL